VELDFDLWLKNAHLPFWSIVAFLVMALLVLSDKNNISLLVFIGLESTI
jgi:hypothetical protein